MYRNFYTTDIETIQFYAKISVKKAQQSEEEKKKAVD